ncbi:MULTISPECIES: long-chain-fatty-acid--CoA ligase [unclassified Arthrobacter]|uniref:long-chain-fatty-acid--CoA ligase n=1 Tax=unclassified Arthrobacter TaxID=235627 RepID=UPI001490BB7B|nr:MULTISPECIES: long-chain-fatty-acid--CoA ligase [unclassified Arthrobacter]MBE0010756.1 long-chain fatty acid--CoA ligase [Arthrobacter sp. AET 35A]NOJ64562.1 AMP-binding protein [Arthrobacter sp. 147(2020)]
MTFDSTAPWVRNYSAGVPAAVDLPEGSLVNLVEDAAKQYGRNVALEFFGAETSYRQLGESIQRAAEGLRRLGVVAGDRVALVLPNCQQHVVAFYAVLRLGAIVVEHNPLYTDRELRHQFEDHGATVAIVWDKAAQRVQDLPADVPVSRIVTVDLTRAMPWTKRAALRLPVKKARQARAALTTTAKLSGNRSVTSWDHLVSNRPLAATHPGPVATDVAALQYTSGTTGHPKGAVLTHRNLLVNAAQGRAWVPGLQDGKEVIYAVLPMFHAYGLTLCLTFAMSIGAKLVLFPKFDEDLVLDAVKSSPPTFLPAVPPIYERLAKRAVERGISLKSVRFAFSGAMNLPPATIELWESVTGGYLVEGYGLTETSPISLGNPIGPTRKPGTVGVPFPNTEIRVVDPDDPARDRAPGETGELLIRGPQVFQGYWRNIEDTRAVLTADGWFKTGDIVRVDEDSFVTIVDRIKEIIVTGGFNVTPTEVEEALLAHDSVADAAVVGMPLPGGGEEVVAAVVVRDGQPFSVDVLKAFCRGSLAAYKIPRRIVEVDELPRSLIGKVLRRQVRDQLIAGDS